MIDAHRESGHGMMRHQAATPYFSSLKNGNCKLCLSSYTANTHKNVSLGMFSITYRVYISGSSKSFMKVSLF